jgi:hypothetical protein
MSGEPETINLFQPLHTINFKRSVFYWQKTRGKNGICLPSGIKKRLLNHHSTNEEIMRRGIIVLGFFIIVLIMTTGCTSPKGSSTGSINQSPALKDTDVETTPVLSEVSSTGCNLSSPDPIMFQKFLPDVFGYEREFGQNISAGNNYRKDVPGWINGIEDHYKIPGQFSQNTVSVSFYDLGPCVTESNGVYARLDNYHFGIYLDTTESTTNFHGYPAIHVIRTFYPSEYIRSDSYRIGINNRIYVVISRYSSADERVRIAEAEADIEKFSNAIDFNGLASMV